MDGHTRLRRRHNTILAYCISFFTLLLVKNDEGVGVDKPVTTRQRIILFVGADGSLDDGDGENEAIDFDIMNESNQKTTNEVGDGESIPVDESSSLPASIVKAANAGAQIREAETSHEGTKTIIEDEPPTSATMNDSLMNINSKIDNRCHWGERGCKRGQANTSSLVESLSTRTKSTASQEDGDKASSPALSSSFAGSATAKIKARITRKNDSSSSTNRRKIESNTSPAWTSDVDNNFDHNLGRSSIQKPPPGFKLSARIVTSPSDGLSYFLDFPQSSSDDDDDDGNADESMMTIPYVYLECGPTIESTTEAFPLTDMVLRHFPASASMGHWVNLGGGITLERIDDEQEGVNNGSSTYIGTIDEHEGQPKLLIALSPIEITVSGNDEESRIFKPGDVILMEDTLGKGHKMNAAPWSRDDNDGPPRGQDMIVLMASLPHMVHFPIYDWLEESSDATQQEHHDIMKESQPSVVENELLSTPAPAANKDEHALSGFAPKNLHHNHQRRRKNDSSSSSGTKKPCPLEYDSAYSSLFMPTHHYHHQYRRSWRTRKLNTRGGHVQGKGSAFDSMKYLPPPGFSTYGQESLMMEYLPSLRRTMLVGLGLSLTSSVVYCAQLLYPPLLALWGGITVIFGGVLVNVLFARWSYRTFIADWEEEWRWKREVSKNRIHRKTMLLLMQQQGQQESGMDLDAQ